MRNWITWKLRGGVVFDAVPGVPSAPRRSTTAARPSRADDAVVLQAPGTRLAPGAAAALAEELLSRELDVLYCDTVVRGDGPRSFHKPQWSPELVRVAPYVGPTFAVRRDLVHAVGPDAASPHDLLLLLAERVPRVQRHPVVWAAHRSLSGFEPDVEAAQRALERSGLHGTVRRSQQSPFLSVALRPTRLHTVTVVVPTRDRADLLERCTRDLRGATDGLDVDLVVVDNGSRATTALDVLERMERAPDTTVLREPAPFNFSRLCNLGLAHARGEAVVFLNDDVHSGCPGWVGQLVANLEDPTIGAAGGLLLFPDGTIQHAGIVLGLGGAAGHGFRGVDPADDGYFGLSTARRDVSAVTGACLAARREDVRAVGGFDERLATDFQDVDLCLRLRARGLRTVLDPACRLVHEESASRGRAHSSPEAMRLLRRRWGDLLADDPFYSPRLPRLNPGYGLAARAH